MDAAHFGCGQADLGGLFGCKEGLNGRLVGEVELGVGFDDKVFCPYAALQKLAQDGRAHHATVACHIDFLKCGHDALLRP